MSLPKALYSLAEDVLIPSVRLFGGEINAMINNIYVKQKVFKVNKTYFKQKGMEYDCHNFYEISSISNEKPSISIKIQKSKQYFDQNLGFRWKYQYFESEILKYLVFHNLNLEYQVFRAKYLVFRKFRILTKQP